MKKFSYEITDKDGIHARPAGALVKTAQAFESQITVLNTANGKSGDAKKIFSVMGLNIKYDTKIDVTIDGADEQNALETLEKFFKENL